MDVAAEDFQAGLRVLFEQGGAGEADEDGAGEHGFHHSVEFTALGAVALVHEDEEFAHGVARLRFQVADEGVEVIHVAPAEFVDEGAEEARFGLAELAHQVAAAAGAVDVVADAGEDALDLFVEFVAVGDDGDAGVRVVFQQPAGEEDHDDAFAAALGVPNDATLALAHVCLGGLDAEVLVDARQFFVAAVEEDEVVQEFEQAVFAAQFEQVFVEFEAGVIVGVLFPGEVVFFFGADRAVTQALGVVTGKDKLVGSKEPLVEFGPLVGDILADAFADGDGAAFEFEDGDGDAVDVEDDIRAAFVLAAQGDFFGDGEVVALRCLPVDEVDGVGDLAGDGFDGDAVVQEVVDGLVVGVEATAVVVGFSAEAVEGGADLGGGVAAAAQVVGEVLFFDVAVANTVGPIAEVAVAEFIAEEGDDTVLGHPFGFANVVHIASTAGHE